MWTVLESFCHYMASKTPRRSKRRIAVIDVDLSKVFNPSHGFGNRDYFTVELSEWLKTVGDKPTIDQLVEFLYTNCVYSIRMRGPLLDAQIAHAKARKAKRKRL